MITAPVVTQRRLEAPPADSTPVGLFPLLPLTKSVAVTAAGTVVALFPILTPTKAS